MDELMRLPSVSRFISSVRRNTGMEWGNVAVPTAQYTRRCCRAASSERAADHHPGQCGVDLNKGKFVRLKAATARR
jgi:sulfane dehydrogenase subunit SoxC